MKKIRDLKSCCHSRRGVLLPLLAFFAGVTMGFILSPVKHGMGNNSGNITNHYYGKDESTDELNQEAFH